MSALVLRDVNKAFGNLIVTRNVELDVQIGERHVIIGPNGLLQVFLQQIKLPIRFKMHQ